MRLHALRPRTKKVGTEKEREGPKRFNADEGAV